MFLETGLQDFSIVKLVCVYVYVRVCVWVGGVKKNNDTRFREGQEVKICY